MSIVAGLHVQVVWDRNHIPAQDVAVTSFDFVESGSGDTWEQTQIDAIDAALAAWWATIKVDFDPNTVLQEIRYYNGYNGDGSPGQVDWVTLKNLPGTAAGGPEPPQCAICVTEVTPRRKSWGRYYLPAPSAGATDVLHYVETATVDRLATASKTLYEAARGIASSAWVSGMAKGACVWGKGETTGGFNPPADVMAAWPIIEVQVDNRMDTIRSRNYPDSSYEKKLAVLWG